MSDADDAVGSVQVKVSPKAIHNAVRNILANEMGLSRDVVLEMLRDMVKVTSEAKIQDITLSYLKDNSWEGARLHNRVKAAMEQQIDDLKPIVKDVARTLVHETIREDIEGVVEAIIRDGFKIRLGWNREARVNVEPAPHAVQAWVPVADRMPPDDQQILVYHGNPWNDGRDVSGATLSKGMFRSSGNGVLSKVTHWRFLPGPPARDET